MTAQRWLKFYSSDWLGDAQLRTCSLAARGLWIDMLCLMDDATPRGHLKLKRKKLDVPTLAGLVNSTPKAVEKLLEELRQAGVFSTTNHGTIYSRKMVRESKWRANGEKAAKVRWSKASENKGENEKRISGSMTPESRVQNKKSFPSRLDATRGQPPPHEPADYSNDPVEPSPALMRSPLVRKYRH